MALLIAGFRPTGPAAVAALTLAALGAWGLASVAWGGIPDVAWTRFDQAVIAGLALVLGSLLAAAGVGSWVAGGVLAGLAAEAVEVIVRLQSLSVSSDWFQGRKVQGPVGYANAQGALAAVGVVLALGVTANRHVAVRSAAGAAAGLLCGELLLTQSRGALLALAVALLAVTLLSLDGRTALLALAAGGSAAALWLPLRMVDRALVAGRRAGEEAAFRHFAFWILGCAVVLALLAAVPPSLFARRALVPVCIAAAVAAGAAALVAHPGTLGSLRRSVEAANSSIDPSRLPGGDTRLTSISFTGRIKTWHAAVDLYDRHPALGAGSGQFARTWDRTRTINNLTVLQPHSIELEVLSELGTPGGVLFGTFVVLALAAVVRRGRRLAPAAAAAAAAFLALVLQASVDWTWSFPALVVAVLLALGAVSGGSGRRPTGLVAFGALLAVTGCLVVGFGAQWLAAHTADRAEAALPADPGRAWDLATKARFYDRWSSAVVEAEARAAEAGGDLRQAAALYRRAAELDQRPWRYDAEAARVLQRAGLTRAMRAECRQAFAENPLELSLREGLCRASRP